MSIARIFPNFLLIIAASEAHQHNFFERYSDMLKILMIIFAGEASAVRNAEALIVVLYRAQNLSIVVSSKKHSTGAR